jgi:hypothetical protein
VAHIVEIPLKFQFVKVPVKWELRTVATTGHLDPGHHTPEEISSSSVVHLCGRLEQVEWKSRSFSELDGWRCRDDFLRLTTHDNEALRKFLESVGLFSFSNAPLSDPRQDLFIEAHEIWRFRETLEWGLQPRYRKHFTAQLAPKLPGPKSLYEAIVRPHLVKFGEGPNAIHELMAAPDIEYPLRFELTNIAAGTVTITNARLMLLATVFVDITRNIRFKVCKRKDCDRQRIFPIESEHERKYCCQYCGHLESVRRNRRIESLKGRSEKRNGSRKRG